MRNPLLVVKNGLEYSGETVVVIPKENGFSLGIRQKDIDAFFADLGYCEAQLMPLRREVDGLYVCIASSSSETEFFERVGFAPAQYLPYIYQTKNNSFECNRPLAKISFKIDLHLI